MKRPCIEPSCPALTERTRCAQHERQRDRGRRPPDQYPHRYRVNRAIVLAGEPRCYVPGCTTPATTADHIVPLRDGGSHDTDNLRPSCVRHNSGRR